MARSYSSLKKILKKKLKTQSFIWRKKILHDYALGIDIEESNDEERRAEIEKLRKRREERAVRKAQRDEEAEALACAQKDCSEPESEEEEEDREEEDAEEVKLLESQSHDEYRARKPKYTNRIHTGYVWNKYNSTHYDHDNPPPKFVQGYKFDIFYPDLVDNTKVPTYTLEKDKDSNNGETCIIKFHAGLPYEDIAFRIVNDDWDYSHKNGFKCTFEGGILHLFFNFKRLVYRR
uniref:Splicing factor Cactin C-terminal domain-containing protein n=1 Tax=Quercus lobata TaxID=97700 RepID=A0A7N2MMY5_QUELO